VVFGLDVVAAAVAIVVGVIWAGRGAEVVDGCGTVVTVPVVETTDGAGWFSMGEAQAADMASRKAEETSSETRSMYSSSDEAPGLSRQIRSREIAVGRYAAVWVATLRGGLGSGGR
jgi:hypothetical protein